MKAQQSGFHGEEEEPRATRALPLAAKGDLAQRAPTRKGEQGVFPCPPLGIAIEFGLTYLTQVVPFQSPSSWDQVHLPEEPETLLK